MAIIKTSGARKNNTCQMITGRRQVNAYPSIRLSQFENIILVQPVTFFIPLLNKLKLDQHLGC